MKKLILLLCVLFGMNGFAQVGEVVEETPAKLIGDINGVFTLEEKEDRYILTYPNAEYSSILDLQFILFYGNENDLNAFYEFIKSAGDNTRKLRVGKYDVHVKKLKKQIMVTVYPDNDVDGHFFITPKLLDKLFGKA